MNAKKEDKPRRLVEHVKTDPFIDLAFVLHLMSDEDWRQVIKRQAEIYSTTGDIGENTTTYHTYKNKVKQFVIKTFQNIYTTIENYLSEEVISKKATRAWRALITLLASQQLMERAGIEVGELLPKGYGQLENLIPVIESIIKEKTSRKRVEGPEAVKKALRNFRADDTARADDIAPLLWWINLVMESEVFEGLFKYHFLVSKNSIKNFTKTAEEILSEVKGHRVDFSYMEYEVLKALLSRCTELRGQYINKLQNATLFVKYLRKGVKDPERWDWFLQNETLTYAITVYMTELQGFSELKEKELNLSTLISPRRGIHDGPASALSTLTLMSPIFMQYVLEARGEIIVTPADIVIAVLRIAKSRQEVEDFVVNVHDTAEEIIRFWDEHDLLRRLKLYTKDEVTPEALYSKKSFTYSLALIINAGVSGIYVSTEKKPVLQLPPRGIGFDSLYVRTQQLLSVTKKVWR